MDPISSTYSFYCNAPGQIIQDGQLYNYDSDMRISNIEQMFHVGVQGDRGFILDLGTVDDISKKYNSLPSESFLGIQIVENEWKISNRFNELVDLDLSGMQNSTSLIKTGHVYMIKIVAARNSSSIQLIAKFMVIQVDKSMDMVQSVVIRQQVLYVDSRRKTCPENPEKPDDSDLKSFELSTSLGLSIASVVLTLFIAISSLSFLIHTCTKGKFSGFFTCIYI